MPRSGARQFGNLGFVETGLRRLSQQFFGECLLKNRFGRHVGREEMSLHCFERVVRLGRSRQRRHHGQMRLVFVAQLGDEANVGIRFQHVRQVLDLLARGFVEDAAFGWGGPAAFFFAAEVAQIAAGSDDHRIEQTGLHQAARRELLQSDSQRKHCDQRRHAHRDADGGQRIPQKRFAQIAQGKFGQIGKLHGRSPSALAWSGPDLAATAEFDSSPTSLPSARKMRRWA